MLLLVSALRLLVWPASAGELVIDARVPTEIMVDGQLRAKLYDVGVVRLPVAPGRHPIVLYVDGLPQILEIDIPETGSASILVGRTGITTSTPAAAAAAPAAAGPITVEFRDAGVEPLLLQIGNVRHHIAPGESLAIELATGDHRLAVRDSAGTTIWARGTLAVTGGGLIVQLAEGRMPEIAGEGGAFRPDGR